MGIAVSYQVQVEHVALCPDVGDVSIPYMVGIPGRKTGCQVGVLEVHVAGVRRVPRLLLRQHEMTASQKVQERVTPSDELTPQFLRQQHVQLHTAQTGSLHPIPLHMFHYHLHALHLRV